MRALRLPTSPPAPLWFRAPGPHAVSLFALPQRRRSAGAGSVRGPWTTRLGGVVVVGSPRFLSDPSCTCAVFSDPGRARCPSRRGTSSTAPVSTHDEGPSGQHDVEAQWHGFGTRCLRFTNDVAVAHARRASAGCSPLPGGSRTLWIALEGFRGTLATSLPPSPGLAWR